MKMTDREINEAVARKCGWEKAHELGIGNGVPDYCSDLNAMHEAEELTLLSKGTNKVLWENYDNCLFRLCGCFARAHATARQRAEAFLRTFNLWKE